MRRSYFGAVFFVMAVLAAPPACGSGVLQSIPWPELAKCAAPVEQGLLNATVEVLKSGPQGLDAIGSRAEQALEDLARQYGASTVSCAVAEAIDLLRGTAARSYHAGAWSDDEGGGINAARRGRDFLAKHAITIEQR